jgi:hypothetical protein
MLLEDLLVIDAPTVYIRPTLGGGVFAVEPIDGATIKRVIDAAAAARRSRRSTGVPADHQGPAGTNYHRDELIYKPRNPRVHKVYGSAPSSRSSSSSTSGCAARRTSSRSTPPATSPRC